jgi:ABC-type amino acid transport substrate-binding protein
MRKPIPTMMRNDQKTIVGLDPDLLGKLGEELGVEIRFARASFDSIIPGLRSRISCTAPTRKGQPP